MKINDETLKMLLDKIASLTAAVTELQVEMDVLRNEVQRHSDYISEKENLYK